MKASLLLQRNDSGTSQTQTTRGFSKSASVAESVCQIWTTQFPSVLCCVESRFALERQTRDSDEGAPLADQRIPSAMQLHNAGIFFKPIESDISSINFDDENCVFYLPSIRLDVNSEVIIRNLLAYETLIKSNTPLVFTRYVELMRAIIDTPADVKILVDSEIIKTELWSEKVAELFKGLSKSIRPTMTPDLDKVIHKVKAKFDTTQKRINWDVIKIYHN